MKLEDVDLYNLDQYEQHGPPYEALALLRREAPVFRHAEPNGPGFWAITKHADIQHCSTRANLFSTWTGGTNIEDYTEDDLIPMRALLVNMDPPEHSQYRKLVSRGFTPRMIAKLEEQIRVRTGAIFDNVMHQGECDFVRDLTVEVPLQVIAEMLGIPNEERQMVFDWSNSLIAWDDPEFQDEMQMKVAAMQILAYGNQLAESRKANPQDDIISVLATRDRDGEQLTDLELGAFVLLLSVAGSETTRNLLSGGMLTFFQHPEQWARLKADRSLLPSAIEEVLRWITPVNYFRRTVTDDTVLRGVELKKGDKIAMYYTSANRDEDVFENPNSFDITRDPNDHLTFGIGEHYCLGANLARLEIRIFFEELLDRMPDVELNGEPRRLRSNFINGIKELPVKFTPEKRRDRVDVPEAISSSAAG